MFSRRASLFCLAALSSLLSGQTVGRISADSMRCDLSFLASDQLAGRFTPSPGLDAAADFIASRFRELGLHPLPDGSYFQIAHMISRTLPQSSTPMTVFIGGERHAVAPEDYTVMNTSRSVEVRNAPVVHLDEPDEKTLGRRELRGRVVVITHAHGSMGDAVQQTGAAMVVFLREDELPEAGSELFEAGDRARHNVPVISVQSESLMARLREGPDTELWRWSASLLAPTDTSVTLRNVVGVIPGSDSALARQVVVLSAHYDHIGTADTAGPYEVGTPTTSDRIYNGANDDASGTVSVIAIAGALVNAHPSRTVLCLAFFGEERGLLGSKFYTAHPLYPMQDTMADLNLEQVGRIDNLESGTVVSRPLTMGLTGSDYTDLQKFIQDAGKATQVSVRDETERSDYYFPDSDNFSFALQGVPATSVTTALVYPDFHAVGDEWQKIDYGNMARINETVALATLTIADSVAPPTWNVHNGKTAGFRRRRTAANRE